MAWAVIPERLAGAIPRCHATFVPGAGHLWHLEHMHVVLRALAGRGEN